LKERGRKEGVTPFVVVIFEILTSDIRFVDRVRISHRRVTPLQKGEGRRGGGRKGVKEGRKGRKEVKKEGS
jgi:hypothetical protein